MPGTRPGMTKVHQVKSPRYRRGIAAPPSCARRCGFAPCSPCSSRTRCWLPFSAQPTIQPNGGLPASAPSNPLLVRMVASPTFVTVRISRVSSWLRFDTGSTPRRSRSTKSICWIGSMRRFPVSQNWSMPPPTRGCRSPSGRDIFACARPRCAGRFPDRPAPPTPRSPNAACGPCSRPRCCASRRPT